ncbi:ferritin-like protein [Actinokineospora auranticolor]|uniref:Ferritin-like protein n=1 Tax=Actinokineospora auranticolor TaxID=155976 RepID=A0A2S6GQJ4_9PSEU|nr:ferritin-like protein [Actinokineospora auranticolor]PPK67469.1 ferritin-like protein [Actinokineospora auranticolor]
MTTTVSTGAPIVELMGVADADVDVAWLRKALQHAMVLELATIPPYSCGLWSIMDPPRAALVHGTILEVIFDEMAHFGLVGNMLSAVGGTPRLTDPAALPQYPGALPGGVRPELEVRLSGLTRAALDMYSAIEEPEEPLASLDESYTSIGAFYRKIGRAFDVVKPALTTARQIEHPLAKRGSRITVLPDLAAVQAALELITEQGEGTSASPGSLEGGLAHYYSFRQLYHGRALSKDNDGTWSYTGDQIVLPTVYAAAEVPAGGWTNDPVNDPTGRPVSALLDAFNDSYSDMLSQLEFAWRTDDPAPRKTMVDAAIGHMAELRKWGRLIVQIPLPDGSGWHYCPEFLLTRADTTPPPRAGD